MIGIEDMANHLTRRRAWNRAFSSAAITEYEEIVARRAMQLVQRLEDDKAVVDDGNNDEAPTDPAPPSIHSEADYTLKKIFQYPKDDGDTLENGLGFYWTSGVKDLDEELELFDLLMEDFDE